MFGLYRLAGVATVFRNIMASVNEAVQGPHQQREIVRNLLIFCGDATIGEALASIGDELAAVDAAWTRAFAELDCP